MSQKIQIKISFVALGLNFFFRSPNTMHELIELLSFTVNVFCFSLIKGSRARLVIFKPEHKLFKFGICNVCQSSSSLTITVPSHVNLSISVFFLVN